MDIVSSSRDCAVPASAAFSRIDLQPVAPRSAAMADQQGCRWLLSSLHRRQGGKLSMTQKLIANTMGVRREGVPEAATKLQMTGLIRCSRGHIAALDRAAREKCGCECHADVREETDRLLLQRTGT
jgi:hypothetical protein